MAWYQVGYLPKVMTLIYQVIFENLSYEISGFSHTLMLSLSLCSCEEYLILKVAIY